MKTSRFAHLDRAAPFAREEANTLLAAPAVATVQERPVYCNCYRHEPEEGYCQNCSERRRPYMPANTAEAQAYVRRLEAATGAQGLTDEEVERLIARFIGNPSASLRNDCRAMVCEALSRAAASGKEVAWQVRRVDGSPLSEWEACTQELYEATRATGRYAGFDNGPAAEVRALYAAPEPCAQHAEPDLRDAPPAGLTPVRKEIQRRQFAAEQPADEARGVGDALAECLRVLESCKLLCNWPDMSEAIAKAIAQGRSSLLAAPAAESRAIELLRKARSVMALAALTQIRDGESVYAEVSAFLDAADAAAEGEEIHVHIEGHDVYTATLQPSGMASPRFVVHVKAQGATGAQGLTAQEAYDVWGDVCRRYDTLAQQVPAFARAILAQAAPSAGARGLTDDRIFELAEQHGWTRKGDAGQWIVCHTNAAANLPKLVRAALAASKEGA